MTDEEFVEEMRKTFEYSKTIWLVVLGTNDKTSKAIFYLSALRKIEREPFDTYIATNAVLSYLQQKLGETFNALSSEEVEDVFCALDGLGVLTSNIKET